MKRIALAVALLPLMTVHPSAAELRVAALISDGMVIQRLPAPVAVRYAWPDNPEGANLYNREGLPASPFRTDDWPVAAKASAKEP